MTEYILNNYSPTFNSKHRLQYVFISLLKMRHYEKNIILPVLLLISAHSQEDKSQVQLQIEFGNKSFSHDENSYAVIVEYSEFISGDETGVYINTIDNEAFIEMPYLWGILSVFWSPKDDYVLLMTNASLVIIDVNSMKDLGNIPLKSRYIWVDDKTLVVDAISGYRIDNIKEKYGIFLHQIGKDSISSRQLLYPDELTDYTLGRLEDNKLTYNQIRYENTGSESPWTRYKEIETLRKEIIIGISIKYGLLNNSRVRIRIAPNLQSEHIGFLDESQRVEILEITEDKMKIENMESEWYRIKTDSGLIGWSYGYFIDIED